MSVPSYSTLLVSLRDRVCWLEFNRPARKNALSTTMYEEVIAALAWAATSEDVHVLVLTGSPLSQPSEHYSSGNDLANFTTALASGETDLAGLARSSCEMLIRFVDAFILFPKALIAAVNGPAHGVAVTTALLADLLYTNEKATFTTPFTRLGQNPEGCSSVLFPALLGQKANRMLLLGETIDAREADRLNFSSGMFSNDTFRDEVHARAKKLADFPLHSVMASKQVSRGTRGINAWQLQATPNRAAAPRSVCLPHAHSLAIAYCPRSSGSAAHLCSLCSSWCVVSRRPLCWPPTETKRAYSNRCCLTRAPSRLSCQRCRPWRPSQNQNSRLQTPTAASALWHWRRNCFTFDCFHTGSKKSLKENLQQCACLRSEPELDRPWHKRCRACEANAAPLA